MFQMSDGTASADEQSLHWTTIYLHSPNRKRRQPACPEPSAAASGQIAPRTPLTMPQIPHMGPGVAYGHWCPLGSFDGPPGRVVNENICSGHPELSVPGGGVTPMWVALHQHPPSSKRSLVPRQPADNSFVLPELW